MTTLTLNTTDRPTHHTVSGIASSLVASFSEFCAGARDGQAIEARYRRYSRMSQPDLAELGMSRAEIYRAALLGRPV
jgi:hypothetical protein